MEKRDHEGINFLKKSKDLYPNEEKYYVAWVESQFSITVEGKTPEEFDALINLLEGKSLNEGLVLKAKILTFQKKFEEALKISESLPKKYRVNRVPCGNT